MDREEGKGKNPIKPQPPASYKAFGKGHHTSFALKTQENFQKTKTRHQSPEEMQESCQDFPVQIDKTLCCSGNSLENNFLLFSIRFLLRLFNSTASPVLSQRPDLSSIGINRFFASSKHRQQHHRPRPVAAVQHFYARVKGFQSEWNIHTKNRQISTHRCVDV